LTLLAGRQEGHPACKKTERWGAGVVICLERGADLHMAQLMPLLLAVSCFREIQIGFTFLVPAHPGSPGKRAVKRVCVLRGKSSPINSTRYVKLYAQNGDRIATNDFLTSFLPMHRPPTPRSHSVAR